MCGEYATFVEDEVSAEDSSLEVDSAVVVVEEDVVWSELLSDVVAEALVDGEELEDDELDGTLVEDDELAAFDVDELLELELELEEDGFDGAELEDEELAGAELDDAELEVEDDGCAEDEEGGDELLGGLAPFCGLPPALLPSNTTKLALLPFGTVTTQKLAPPTPTVPPPDISFTLCFEGSMAQGRPLQPPPSQTISTPQVGILSRKGVAGSR